MSRFINQHLAKLAPYVPGEQPTGRTFVKLNTNESPFPPAPGVAKALNRECIERMRLYPDPSCTRLREAAADYYGLSQDEVLPTNGSDEALFFAFQAYTSGGRSVYYPDVTYGFYKVYASLLGAKGTAIPLNDAYEIQWKDYFDRDGMIVFANPNAPTGHYLNHERIKRIVDASPDQVVLVDEATLTMAALIKQYDNLLVVQTFSKSRAGGAALRLCLWPAAAAGGFKAHPELHQPLFRQRAGAGGGHQVAGGPALSCGVLQRHRPHARAHCAGADQNGRQGAAVHGQLPDDLRPRPVRAAGVSGAVRTRRAGAPL